MARLVRNAKLDSRSSRAGLPPAHEPYWIKLAPRQFFGYFKPKKGAGTWRARLYLPEEGLKRKTTIGTADDFADPNGTTILDFAQAQAKAQKWLQDCAQNARETDSDDGPKAGYTVADALVAYLKDINAQGQKSARISEQVIAARIKPTLGEIPIEKLTRRKIQDWLTDLAESARLKTGRKREEGMDIEHLEGAVTIDAKRARKATANRVFAILKRALNLALENRRAKNGHAWQSVKPFRNVAKARIRFLSQEDQVRLVNACTADFQRLVRGALLTGARYGELAKVEVRDFDAKAGTLLIAESKSGKSRHIVLTKEGQGFFIEQTAGRKASDQIFLRDSAARTKRKDLGLSWGPTEQGPLMAAACAAAGLDPVTFHELRHSYASMLVNKGVPLAYVAAQLGHSDTRMVEKHYGHLAPSDLAKSIRKLVPTLGITEEPKIKPLKIKKSS